MKLPEKLLYCRKKAGLSQEALAERLGVSRQAISKWETGDAVPEIGKLLLIANTFGVTTDWLLSEDEPAEEKTDIPPFDTYQFYGSPSWMDSAPGLIGRLIRRFGWLSGVYLVIVGAGFTGVGALARYLIKRMFSDSLFGTIGNIFPGATVDLGGIQIMNPMTNLHKNNPVFIMGTFIMVLGIIMMIAGALLAKYLKKRSMGRW